MPPAPSLSERRVLPSMLCHAVGDMHAAQREMHAVQQDIILLIIPALDADISKLCPSRRHTNPSCRHMHMLFSVTCITFFSPKAYTFLSRDIHNFSSRGLQKYLFLATMRRTFIFRGFYFYHLFYPPHTPYPYTAHQQIPIRNLFHPLLLPSFTTQVGPYLSFFKNIRYCAMPIRGMKNDADGHHL